MSESKKGKSVKEAEPAPQQLNPIQLFQSGMEKYGKLFDESNEAVDKKSLELDEAERTCARLKSELIELQNIRFKASLNVQNVYQRLTAAVSISAPPKEEPDESESDEEPALESKKKKKVQIAKEKDSVKITKLVKKGALKKIKSPEPEPELAEKTDS